MTSEELALILSEELASFKPQCNKEWGFPNNFGHATVALLSQLGHTIVLNKCVTSKVVHEIARAFTLAEGNTGFISKSSKVIMPVKPDLNKQKLLIEKLYAIYAVDEKISNKDLESVSRWKEGAKEFTNSLKTEF